MVTCTARTKALSQWLRSKALLTTRGCTSNFSSPTSSAAVAPAGSDCFAALPSISIIDVSAPHNACSLSRNESTTCCPANAPAGYAEDSVLSATPRVGPAYLNRNWLLAVEPAPAAPTVARSPHTRAIKAAENESALSAPTASLSVSFRAAPLAQDPCSRLFPLPIALPVMLLLLLLLLPSVAISCRAKELAESATVGSQLHFLLPGRSPQRHACNRHSRAVHGNSGLAFP